MDRRKLEVDFAGGEITSDAGGLPLRQVAERLGLTRRLAKVLPDERWRKSCGRRWGKLSELGSPATSSRLKSGGGAAAA